MWINVLDTFASTPQNQEEENMSQDVTEYQNDAKANQGI